MPRRLPAHYANKNVLVTGAASGLGLMLARRFASQGANLILLGRSQAKLDEACRSIRSLGHGIVKTISVDVQDRETLQAMVLPVLTDSGGLDILVNNAGIAGEGYFEDFSMEDHRRFMETNYFGCLNLINLTLPLLKRRQGMLINVASLAGLVGSFGFSAYCASKHALVGLTEVLHYELEPQGIKVHLVCPGEFMTPMVEALEEGRTPENRASTLTIPRVTVELVVDQIFTGIAAGRFRIIPGLRARLLMRIGAAFPELSQMLVKKRIADVYVGPADKAH